jgi:catechol 2,3-dioxygenase-like lactoylglutathione lyase family enzyme
MSHRTSSFRLVNLRYCLLFLVLVSTTALGQERLVAPSWTSVTVGVANLDKALELWVGTFGFEKLASSEGEDAELATLWKILPTDIKRQALLGMPGSTYGKLHLVEFTEPGPPVREGAQVFDLCPKNLDIYVSDLPARVKEMQANGISFRNPEPSEVTAPDGTVFREIHMPGHDEINIVLLEVIGKEMEFSDKGFTGIGPLIAIVDQAEIEKNFYASVMGMDILSDNLLEGPEIEKMIGLPPGAKLDVSIWGQKEYSLGQIELVDYQGVKSNNLYPVTVPTQLGILHTSYAVTDIEAFKQKLHDAGINHFDRGYRELIFGSGKFIRFRTPGGMNIEAFEVINIP